MDKVSVKLTVLFEEPFWVGILERTEQERLNASKITFGPEPKDYEVDAFLTMHWKELRWSPAVEAGKSSKEWVNPKRRIREARRELEEHSVGTKSQQALKQMQEETKQMRKVRNKEEEEARKERLFQLKQHKKKEKHKGR